MITPELILNLTRCGLVGVSVCVIVAAFMSGKPVEFLIERNPVLIPVAVIAYIVALL